MDGLSFFATLAAMGALFWVAVVAGLIVLGVLLEHEKVGWAGATTAAMFVMAYFWVDGFTLQWVVDNTWSLLGAVATYLAVGVGWSFAKWYLYLKDRRIAYDDARRDFLAAQGLPVGGPIPPELVPAFRQALLREGFWRRKPNRADRIAPSARDHKDHIISWIFWWPISILSSLFADLARWIYNALRQEFQHMSDRLFSEVTEELDGD